MRKRMSQVDQEKTWGENQEAGRIREVGKDLLPEAPQAIKEDQVLAHLPLLLVLQVALLKAHIQDPVLSLKTKRIIPKGVHLIRKIKETSKIDKQTNLLKNPLPLLLIACNFSKKHQ